MKKTKAQNGITLVALIITIIVLLILAVVAISAVKDSDIIKYAKNSKETYAVAQEKEQIQLALNGWFVEKRTATEPDAYKSYLIRELSDVATVTGEKTLIVTFNETGNQYLLNENCEQVTTVTDLERYIFGQDLVGRPIFDIASMEDEDLMIFSFFNDDSTLMDESVEIIYSDTSIENNFELIIIYFKYEDEFYKFAINMDEKTDINYGLVKLPKVDTSNYTILEKYMFGEHGQGRFYMFLYDVDSQVFINNSTIPNASTALTESEMGGNKLYFRYEDELYKVAVKEDTYSIDVDYGVIKVDDIEEGTDIGKKVQYDNKMWTILYDDDINGLQMICDEPTSYGRIRVNNIWVDNAEEEKITGKSLYNGYIYNTALQILNLSCEKKVPKNSNIMDVRSVGSNPTNKNLDNNRRYTSKLLETLLDGKANGKLKTSDSNLDFDFERMKQLGILNIGEEYWLASRIIQEMSDKSVYCGVRTYKNYESSVTVCYISENGANSPGAGGDKYLRPVIKLDPSVVFLGTGTDKDPYTF